MGKKREKPDENFDPMESWQEFKLMMIYIEKDLKSSLRGNKEAGYRARRTIRAMRRILHDIQDRSREIEKDKRSQKQQKDHSIKKLQELKDLGKK